MSDVSVVSEDGFHRSSRSGTGNCVEVRFAGDGGVEVRNSRAADAPLLSFTPSEWAAFVAGVKLGEFDPA